MSALACVVALAMAGAPMSASAQTSAESLANTRAAIDATANRWFAAQRESQALDLQIETLDQTLGQAEHRVERLRHVANARVVDLYESGTQTLDGLMGGDPLEVGRRAELIGQANTDGQVVIDKFESSIADLNAQRSALHAARKTLAKTLRDLVSERKNLDTELASLQLRSAAHAAQRAELAATIRRGIQTVTTSDPTRPAVIQLAAPVVPAATPVVTGPVAPADTGAVSPHHDDPFLVCTRARESNGEYSVASGNGYYGAYQFAATTWNVTAEHMGRLDLVGVLPSNASPYDQDEMAWSLYEWQGNTPWGGRC